MAMENANLQKQKIIAIFVSTTCKFTVCERIEQEIILLISFRSLECAWEGKNCLFICEEIVLTKRKSDKADPEGGKNTAVGLMRKCQIEGYIIKYFNFDIFRCKRE